MASNYQSLAIIRSPAYVTHFSVAYGNTTSLHMRQLFFSFHIFSKSNHRRRNLLPRHWSKYILPITDSSFCIK